MKKEIIVILNSIRSNENVGSIFRTCDAVGVSKIILCGYTPAPIDRFGRENRGLTKASLGAEKFVKWEKVESLKSAIYQLKNSSSSLSTDISLLGNSSARLSQPAQGSQKEYLAPLVFKPWSNYPFITRDIAVWVPFEIKPEKLSEIYHEFGTELLVCEPKLFDQFTKPAKEEGEITKTSYAHRLVFQSYEKTLTDDEVNVIMGHIEEKISSLGWIVR